MPPPSITNDFKDSIIKQTAEYDTKLQESLSKHMVYSQKTEYMTPGLENYYFTNVILFAIYFCVVGLVAYRLYPSVKYTKNMKIAIMIGFVIYPFVISAIELRLFDSFYYYYALITGTVFEKYEL